MAGLAGLSVGFVVFAMPEAVLSNAIRTSGLPSVMPAAEPPLGDAARFGLVAIAAVATFLFVWFLLRALGSKMPASAGRESPAREEAFEVPRLRRADAHPDAPSRRPLFARDLGEPLVPLDLAEPTPGPDASPEAPEAEPAEALSPSRDAEEPPLPAAEEPSIASLMQRLEQGLLRRQQEMDHAAPVLAPVAHEEDPVDSRLRSALSDLQRLAARQA